MKQILYLSLLLLLINWQAQAQSWLEKMGNRVKDRAVEQVENRIEDRAGEAVDKGLDEAEGSVKKSTKKKEKSTKDTKEESANVEDQYESPSQNAQQQSKTVSYLKYDFVPGNEVIFDDDLKGEQKGEFPSRWDLEQGAAEIALVDNENAITMIGYTFISPLFKNNSKNYLPEQFTLEYDFLIDGNEGEHSIEFCDASDQVIASTLFWKDNKRFIAEWNKTTTENNSEDTYDNSNGWHHMALSFNQRAMKIYVDAKRVANIPNMKDKPAWIRLFARGPEDNSAFHIKNVRIAKGAVPLYNRLLASGKIITYGITFDVGKSTIKPQSMGTLNEICEMLKAHPELRFSVEGHTDNTGSATSNQTLSESRAKAVCNKLSEMGIEASRLTAKGFGMNKPLDSNETTEGRAKNRRVEFVKL